MTRKLIKYAFGGLLSLSLIFGAGTGKVERAYGGAGSYTALCNLWRFNSNMETDIKKKIAYANLANTYCMMAEQEATNEAARIRADGERDAARIRAESGRKLESIIQNYESRLNWLEESFNKLNLRLNYLSRETKFFSLAECLMFHNPEEARKCNQEKNRRVFRDDETIMASFEFKVNNCDLCNKAVTIDIINSETGEMIYNYGKVEIDPDNIIRMNDFPNDFWTAWYSFSAEDLLKKLGGNKFGIAWSVDKVPSRYDEFIILESEETRNQRLEEIQKSKNKKKRR